MDTSPAHRLSATNDLVAYFCAEYAVDPRLPIYSGGLGVLAGDHLKTASDMSVPLIAVGLLYSEGYFTQRIDASGQQHADPMPVDPQRSGLSPVLDVLGRELMLQVPMADHAVKLRLWRKDVGRVPLFLLDADVAANAAEDRAITARLYGTGHDLRLRQEIVLGIGGVRAVRALGLTPSVWHINEGHAAFLILERMRERIAYGYSFDAALEAVAACTVFTTHTPVPAGHDVFDQGQLRHWLGDYAGTLHTTERRLFALGGDGGNNNRFNMTTLAIRGSRFRNGVSRLHGKVAAQMERAEWPQIPPEDNPITGITNGVHLPTFLAAPWQALLDRHAEGWRTRAPGERALRFLDEISDAELSVLRADLRATLLAELRARLRSQHLRIGTPLDVIDRLLHVLDDADQRGAPLLGFARRFATYKRATLLLHDTERLHRLLAHPERPALLVFAGKAHPNDGAGQDMIRHLYQCSMRPEFLGRLLVLEGYDLALARLLVQGCDVWLNTPEYPMEASGTSGMKAGANGCINVSILDGWWAEGHDGANGFAIPHVAHADAGQRDAAEAGHLYELLEQQVLPEYYGAEGRPPSSAWLRRVRRSVQTIASRFSAVRMVNDYIGRLYLPAAEFGRRANAGAGKIATNLARWKSLVRQHWHEVRIEPVVPAQPLRVCVHAAGLPADLLAAEAVIGSELRLPLRMESHDHDRVRFVLDGPVSKPPHELRIYPRHPLLPHPYEMGLMTTVAVPAA
ncbi:alpha-glucan family phosphorylase [Fontimonas sp. SYSU GA230001]|uniref:alpha-glucan family phosphorylase n=1 Tax=Fontimonas sp. SYSU GA230001 TaxID=3142450 RepID=UPI0032B5DB7C